MLFWGPSTFVAYIKRPAVGRVVIHTPSFCTVRSSFRFHFLQAARAIHRNPSLSYFIFPCDTFSYCFSFLSFACIFFYPSGPTLSTTLAHHLVQLCNTDLFDTLILSLSTDRYRPSVATYTRIVVFFCVTGVWSSIPCHFQCWIPILLSSRLFSIPSSILYIFSFSQVFFEPRTNCFDIE